MEKIQQFWALVLDVWGNGMFGIDIGRYIIAIFIFSLFILLRRLFTKIVISRVKALTEKTETEIDDQIFKALEEPFQFIPIVLGLFLATEYLQLSGSFEIIAERFNRSLIVFCIFWGVIRCVRPMSFLLRKLEKIFTSEMVDWLLKAISGAFVFIGVATILEIWGIKVGPIIAGFGLFGVAVALGAQDLFKNLISGILIIAEKRFMKGDWIRVNGEVEGTVENIGFRSTLVCRFDKAPVFVPNATLSDQSVINFSAMTHRRIYWKIGVEYSTTVDQLRSIRDAIEHYILNTQAFAKPPEVLTFVRFDTFNESSIDIMVYCFTKTTKWGEWLEVKEALAYRIKEIIEGAGTGFAFPSQSVYIETLPSDKPEIYIPPAE
jgi:MscS family membrane protein